MKNLNYEERINKAVSLILNKSCVGRKSLIEQHSHEFKKLINGLGLSIEFFLMDLKDTNKRQTKLKTKIKKFIEIAKIKTELSFYFGKSLNENKVFTMLL